MNSEGRPRESVQSNLCVDRAVFKLATEMSYGHLVRRGLTDVEILLLIVRKVNKQQLGWSDSQQSINTQRPFSASLYPIYGLDVFQWRDPQQLISAHHCITGTPELKDQVDGGSEEDH